MSYQKPLFDPRWFIVSDWPANIIPNGSLAIVQTSEDGTLKGFYDPSTGELHIQEIDLSQAIPANELLPSHPNADPVHPGYQAQPVSRMYAVPP